MQQLWRSEKKVTVLMIHHILKRRWRVNWPFEFIILIFSSQHTVKFHLDIWFEEIFIFYIFFTNLASPQFNIFEKRVEILLKSHRKFSRIRIVFAITISDCRFYTEFALETSFRKRKVKLNLKMHIRWDWTKIEHR